MKLKIIPNESTLIINAAYVNNSVRWDSDVKYFSVINWDLNL